MSCAVKFSFVFTFDLRSGYFFFFKKRFTVIHTISSTEVYAKLIAFKEDPGIVRAKHTSIGTLSIGDFIGPIKG